MQEARQTMRHHISHMVPTKDVIVRHKQGLPVVYLLACLPRRVSLSISVVFKISLACGCSLSTMIDGIPDLVSSNRFNYHCYEKYAAEVSNFGAVATRFTVNFGDTFELLSVITPKETRSTRGGELHSRQTPRASR